MRKNNIMLLLALLLCAIVAGTSLASEKNLRKTMTLTEDVMVGETVIKKGTYKVRFDAKTSEVSILDEDNDPVVQVKASVQTSENKARYNSVSFTQKAEGKLLSSLTFAGDKRRIVFGDAATMNTDSGSQNN